MSYGIHVYRSTQVLVLPPGLVAFSRQVYLREQGFGVRLHYVGGLNFRLRWYEVEPKLLMQEFI